MENGVEVVLNGPVPYALAGEPHALTLKEEVRIDTEDETVAAVGLTDIAAVDADDQGRIYAFRLRANSGPLAYRFDSLGRFEKSFMPVGQGPGEIQEPRYLRLTRGGEIPVFNRGAQALEFFDLDGRFLRKLAAPGEFRPISGRPLELLANGGYVALRVSTDPNLQILGLELSLLNASLRPTKDLSHTALSSGPIETPFPDSPIFAVSDRAVFVSSYKPGSDILVYDLDGRLLRRIRLGYPAPEVTAEFRKDFLSIFPANYPLIKSLKFPERFPHVLGMTTDEAGRLYVIGFGKDTSSGANICDIFTPDGARIVRTALGHESYAKIANGGRISTVIKNGQAYFIREKPDGYQEIVVSSLTWSGAGA